MTTRDRKPLDSRKLPEPNSADAAIESEVRAFALAYPETHEDFPWGVRVIKVRNKVFVFMGQGLDGFGISVKLPHSHQAALTLSWTEPTGYGLGRAGWVPAHLRRVPSLDMDLIKDWIDESYRAVAPKTLVAKLPTQGS